MNKIDGIIFKQMIISGSNNLFNSYPEIDALNVFPVPDGDTGTNMNLTMSSGVKEVANKNDKSIYNISKAFSRGLLMGARGNSGVILSQIFRGFTEGLNGKEEVDAIELSEAFEKGREVAYKAVMRPVEGTILTVVKDAASALSANVEPNMPIDKAMEVFYAEAKASLIRTPDLLPVLKEVGVVDSGGAGFCKIIDGFLKALKNQIVQRPEMDDYYGGKKAAPIIEQGGESLETVYRTDFVLLLPEKSKLGTKREFSDVRFKSVLNAHGDHISMDNLGTKLLVSINTKFPGNILSFAQQYGEFSKVTIEKTDAKKKEEVKAEEKPAAEKKAEGKKPEEPVKEEKAEEAPVQAAMKKYGLIACCSGKGVEEIFKSQRVDYIVSGGQTMNPSTEDFVKAIKAVGAQHVYIFPNNGNIIMAAKQAAEVCSECKVYVIPSKTIPEGIVSSMMFNPEVEPEDNKTEMESALSSVKTGQVTFAIRDSSVDGVEVKKNQFIGIDEKKIEFCLPDKIACAEKLIDSMVDDMSSVLTLILGADVTKDEETKITDYVSNKFGEDIDIDIKRGEQPVYSFIIGVE